MNGKLRALSTDQPFLNLFNLSFHVGVGGGFVGEVGLESLGLGEAGLPLFGGGFGVTTEDGIDDCLCFFNFC